MKRFTPGPGQESVWDYPRPPRVEATSRHLEVYFRGERIADTRSALRVLETSHPPTYYIPPADVDRRFLIPSAYQSACEFKGVAHYFHLVDGEIRVLNAAWSYPSPKPPFDPVQGHFAFYPSRVEACFVDGERVLAQEGDFYGGWITADVAGPFKGGPGTRNW